MSEFGSTIETLKAAGFSEEEINQHTKNSVSELVAAGFDNDEINNHADIIFYH